MIVNFTLTGVMPLLMHADDVEEADALGGWRGDPANKDASVAGDDRSPPWTWQTYLYSDGTHVTMPMDNLMASLRAAAAKIPVPKGQGRAGETFKKMSQSGILITSEFCRFTTGGRQIAMADVLKFRDRPFSEHKKGAAALGFDLSVKRAKIPTKTTKHVRVRAKFTPWEVEGVAHVSEPRITLPVLREMFEICGRLVGLCDWRPGSPSSPGPYGMFTPVLKVVDR